MAPTYVATQPVFIGRARAANAGDTIPATHPQLQEWLDAGVVEEAPAEKSVDDMTVDELKAYAEARNIDLGGATRKPEILAAVKAAG